MKIDFVSIVLPYVYNMQLRSITFLYFSPIVCDSLWTSTMITSNSPCYRNIYFPLLLFLIIHTLKLNMQGKQNLQHSSYSVFASSSWLLYVTIHNKVTSKQKSVLIDNFTAWTVFLKFIYCYESYNHILQPFFMYMMLYC